MEEKFVEARNNGFSYIQGDSKSVNFPEFILTPISFNDVDDIARENLKRLYNHALDILNQEK